MLRVAGKVRHHSTEQVVEAVREARQVADDCELSDADRAILLPSILNLVSAVHLELEQVEVNGLGVLGRHL